MAEKIEYKEATYTEKVPYIRRYYCDECNKIISKEYGEKFDLDTGYRSNRVYEEEKILCYDIDIYDNMFYDDDDDESFLICKDCINKFMAKYFEKISKSDHRFIIIHDKKLRTLPLTKEDLQSTNKE